MILKQEGTSVLDNFLDEMVQFIHEREQKVRCFVISFIEKACKKDSEVFKRAIATLNWAMIDQSSGVIVQKKFSEVPKSGIQMSLDEIGRDSFISWRQLQLEAQHSFNNLMDQIASTHITSLNLVTAISCICNIARQRPEKMPDVIGALEQLHLNLPPTLECSNIPALSPCTTSTLG
uniref:DUF3453 domain-containing protein n=1 Tax=Globodera pallida TaxID=36090 RepID=A0A183C1G2_GLOPA